jgi:hypothetical protein
MALAHTVADRVEAAYHRGDLFEKRRELVDAWARYCEGIGDGTNVVRLASRPEPRCGVDKQSKISRPARIR